MTTPVIQTGRLRILVRPAESGEFPVGSRHELQGAWYVVTAITRLHPGVLWPVDLVLEDSPPMPGSPEDTVRSKLLHCFGELRDQLLDEAAGAVAANGHEITERVSDELRWDIRDELLPVVKFLERFLHEDLEEELRR